MPSRILMKLLEVLIGLAVLAFGIVLYIRSGLGSDAFTVFYAGLAKAARISTGTSMQLCLVSLLALVFFLDRKLLGIGTVLHAVLVGFFIDRILLWPIAEPSHPFAAALMLFLAIFSVGSGLALYIHAGLGAGAIDALMLIIRYRTNWKIKSAKIALDAVLAILGFFMGGKLGIGTIGGMLLTGPVIQLMLRFYDSIQRRVKLNPISEGKKHEA